MADKNDIKITLKQDRSQFHLEQDSVFEDLAVVIHTGTAGLMAVNHTDAFVGTGSPISPLDLSPEFYNTVNGKVDTFQGTDVAGYALIVDENGNLVPSDSISEGVSDLNTRISAEISRATAAESTLQDNINEENAQRIAADSALQTEIDTLSSTLSQEVADRIADVNAEESRAKGIEGSLSSLNTSTKTNLVAAINEVVATTNTIDDALAEETAARISADSTLQDNINQEAQTRASSDADLAAQISAESSAREAADTALQNAINTKQNILTAGNNIEIDADVISAIVPVVNDAILTIQRNSTTIGTFSANDDTNHTINITVPTQPSDIDALPASTKYGKDLTLSYNNSTNILSCTLLDQDGNALSTTKTVTLPLAGVVVGGTYNTSTKIITLSKYDGSTQNIDISSIINGLQAEITSTNKLSADLVDDNITTHKFVSAAEKSTWNAKQDALTAGSHIDITGTTISTTGLATQTDLDDEVADRTAADTTLQGNIDNINALIPGQASTTNQLADKDFVNSSIQSMSAIRVYATPTQDYFPTRAALLAATTFYDADGNVYTLSRNDYTIVLSDEGAPAPYTNGQTRWSYSGSVWAYDIGINERPFTAAEQAAIGSGITSTKVSNYDTHLAARNNPHQVTKAQVGLGNVDNTSDLNKPISTATQNALNAKQNTLTAGTGISIVNDVISNTQTSAVWGNIAGDIDDQSDLGLKLAAKANVADLATVATSGSYNDLSDKPTIPGVNDAILTIQRNSTTIGTFSANSANPQTINLLVPTSAADVSALPASTKYAVDVNASLNSTYQLIVSLKDQDGNLIGSAKTVSLPIGDSFVSATYNSTNKNIIFTKRDNTTASVDISSIINGLQAEITSTNKLSADLVDDTSTTHKFTTATEKSTWNAKQNALVSGTNIKTINSTSLLGSGNIAVQPVISDLSTIRSGAAAGATAVQPADLATVATSGSYNDLSDKPTIGAGTLTIQKNGTTVATFSANATGNTTANIEADVVAVDGSTIDKNTDDELEAIAVLNQNGGVLHTWKGTLAEYEALSTYSNDTQYIITDDTINSDYVTRAELVGITTTPLLSHIWADHLINDMRWTRGDSFSWKSADEFEVVYDHLVDDIDGKTLQSETIGGVTVQFYLADDGHKICLVNEITNVESIFNTTGSAWYYILDTDNRRFKLPRRRSTQIVSSVENSDGSWYRLYASGWVEQGGISVSGSGTSGTITLPITMQDNNYTAIAGNGNNAANNYFTISRPEATTTTIKWYKSSASMNGYWQVSGMSAIDMSSFQADEKYLYFFVGNFTQTAVENTAGLNSESFNNKADLDLSNVLSNIDYIVESQLPTAANNYTWYRKYKSGWVEQGGFVAAPASATANVSVTLPVTMRDGNYSITTNVTQSSAYSSNQDEATMNSCIIRGGATNRRTTTGFYFSYMSSGFNVIWEVKGVAA